MVGRVFGYAGELGTGRVLGLVGFEGRVFGLEGKELRLEGRMLGLEGRMLG